MVMPDEETLKIVLANGLKILIEPVPNLETVSIGVWIGTGSSNETLLNNGVSHFVEHLLFKEQESLLLDRLIGDFEKTGGKLNAFTEREFTSFNARTLKRHLDIAIQVLGKIVSNRNISNQEINLERKIIQEEICKNSDSLGDYIREKVFGLYWGKVALGLPLTGTEESVAKIDETIVHSYLNQYYICNNIIISIVGPVYPNQVLPVIEDSFGSLLYGPVKAPLESLKSQPPKTLFEKRSIKQVHFCLGFPGVPYSEEKNVNTLSVLNALLNGGLKSRFFMNVREKLGLTYSIANYRFCYRNDGIFIVYAATRVDSFAKLRDILLQELQHIATQKIDESELDEAKNKVISNFCFNMENLQFRMTRIAQAEYYFKYIPSASHVIASIDAVTSDDILALAGRLFDPKKMVTTAIGPLETGI